jgi:tRNA(fMet)-specific endonuclease VapC
MLDTNIVSDLVKNPSGKVADKISEVGDSGLAISVIVAAELRFGARKRGSPALSRRVETILSGLPILPFESPADFEYAAIRAALESRGEPIGGNDLFVAAHAKALNVPLVTQNVAEFRRVPGLSVLNWLQ